MDICLYMYLGLYGKYKCLPFLCCIQTRLNDHHVLTRALIDDYSKDEDGERNLEWSGELGTESERLLEYHGVLNGLNKLQIASV